MEQGTQQDFMNMIQDYESHEFNLCWINFLELYPNTKFPKEYAEWEWQQTWAEEEFDAQELIKGFEENNNHGYWAKNGETA